MPNLGELIFTLTDPTKYDIRRFEKCFIKLQKLELSCAFNKLCLKEDKLPIYTQYIYVYIYIANFTLRKFNFYSKK